MVVKSFSDNYLKLNDNKCHSMIFGDKCSKGTVTIRNSTIDESDHEKLLGTTSNKKLSFRKYVEDLFKKAIQKLHALAHLFTYIDSIKLKVLINSFISSQCNYYPLVWMFYDSVINSKSNLTQERALRPLLKVVKHSLKS